MAEYFISSNNKYTYEENKYLKNDVVLLDEEGNEIDETTFKRLIQRETAKFIHQNYSNIIVLVGAGASVLCTNDTIDPRFGKTVAMLANVINTELKKDSKCFSFKNCLIFASILFQLKCLRVRINIH